MTAMAQRFSSSRSLLAAACLAALVVFALPAGSHAQEAGKKAKTKAAQAETAQTEEPTPFETEFPALMSVEKEIQTALVRLPLAAVLGSVLALRPRRRGQASRSILVVQTQIMLAVVGAVVMLVVGNSLSRAFGIVGAAGLVRYRSTIDDPKEAVVMLCALGAGLASGVGLYALAPFATLFMTAVLYVVEYFEPTARKFFELEVTVKRALDFRPKMESVLSGFKLDYELLSESEDSVRYTISAPYDVRTRDVSDTLTLLSGDADVAVEWTEKKTRK
jgi:uncharacterized membrane protein YhiD involved in acid resistance